MSENPFRSMVKDWNQATIASAARGAGLAKGTVGKIVNSMNRIPPNVELGTLAKLARYFGYRLEVTLVKENES